MRLGVSIAQSGRLADPAAIRSAATGAEQVGYSSVWVVDRLGRGRPDLSTMLDTERIVMFPWSVETTINRQVVVDVLRFEGTMAGDVVLDARWRVLGPARQELVLQHSVVREPAGQVQEVEVLDLRGQPADLARQGDQQRPAHLGLLVEERLERVAPEHERRHGV